MKPLRLLTITVFAAATVPRLAHPGMFVDGVTYASIARNLAEGRGRFWAPSYTATVYPQFHEHPPLGFWLQSLWFRVLGDHLFVERLFSLSVAVATAWVMSVMWRQVRGRDARDEWLPMLLWMAAPAVSWSIAGNLLEISVAFFTTAAIAATLHAAWHSSGRAAIGWSALSGLCVVAACLVKGPVGLFPLAAPVAFLLLPDRRHATSAIVAQWTTVAACAALLLAWPAARTSLTDYVNQQVIAAVAGEREVSGSSVTILKELLQGVLLPMAGVGVLAVAASRRFVAPRPLDWNRAVTLLLLGLAGTLPILFSAKQAGHYLVPAIPLYALAAAMVLAPTVRLLADRLETGRSGMLVYLTSAIIALGAAGAAVAPGFGRDRVRIADLDAIADRVPRDQIVGICPDANGDWGLHAWFERRFHVALDGRGGRWDRSIGGPQQGWFLQTGAVRPGCPPAGCAAATDPTRALVLMTCRRAD